MEEKTKNGHPEGCRCVMCGGWHGVWAHGRGHWLLRLILGVIILLLVFWLGFKLGKLVVSINGGYGYLMRHGKHWGYPGYYNMMGPGYYGDGCYGYGPGMMRGWQGATSTSSR